MDMNVSVQVPGIVPFRLKNAPSLIERIWPAQKISVEAQKERKAVHGQTLTGLGSYWKGRKPLILARACLLGALLPSTGDDEKDLEIFDLLVGMHDEQIAARFKTVLSVEEIHKYATEQQRASLLEENDEKSRVKKLTKEVRANLMSKVIARMPYQMRVDKLLRPEEVSEDRLTATNMARVNEHLGTTATTLPELVEQLGIMRFGHRPRLGDTFCGGGSIPFEMGRLGCDVYASDLNPIACMLTWGAFNIVGATAEVGEEIEADQRRLAETVDADICELGIEHDQKGNRAKAYLYCLETKCPQTGWMVPMTPSLVISELRRVVAKLVPDKENKRIRIEIKSGVTKKEMIEAALGTVRDKKLVYSLDGETYSTPIKTIRGDRKSADGETINDLRRWDSQDFVPRPNDILQERLYCIQWITKDSIIETRQETFFAAPTAEDIDREKQVEQLVRKSLAAWQVRGYVSDMEIETGKENEGPIRTNGWKFWHQMFMPRAILTAALIAKHGGDRPHAAFSLLKYLDNSSKACRWAVSQSGGDGGAKSTFDNQALKTIFNWATRSFPVVPWRLKCGGTGQMCGHTETRCSDARRLTEPLDIGITDPPYADAVNYHEILEFFIAWLRKKPPEPFQDWIWDSRRPLAIKGEGTEFRQSMVEAYKALADNMPDNGLQIVMFTHQDAGVWADMAQIFWGAGLQVMAAWYIATETTSELKKGGYVQGTVILVLRKHKANESGYKDEIVQEVKVEVADQINTMVGLNQSLKGRGRIESLFEDADLQMAGYAAALRILTKYAKIDGIDMSKEALRPRKQGEMGLIADIIDFAVQVANEQMVPDGLDPSVWERLTGSERFYLKMMDIETTGARKLDNYQNFAKAFRVSDYGALMGSVEPNKANLRTAAGFKKTGFEGSEFGASKSRALLYAIYEIQKDVDSDDVLAHLRDLVPNYMTARDDLMIIAGYIEKKRADVDEEEARAAGILYGLIHNERLG
jgi:putative DNA methylase